VSQLTNKKTSVTMDDLLQHAAKHIHGFSKSQKVQATFVRAERGLAFFDIGGKSEAVVNGSYFTESKDFIKTLQQGKSVLAVVMDPEDREGRTVLSLKHAAAEMFWKKLYDVYEKGELISVTAKTVTDRGVAVEISGNAAFIPFSQLKPETSQNPDALTDKKFKVMVLEVDQPRGRIVLSERAITDGENLRKMKDLLTAVENGQVLDGVVTTITSFGAFVEITINGTPIEGLVHVSELSWGGKVGHPSDILNEGDKVKVSVLGTTSGKLALSLKRATDDPWTTVADAYHVDDKLKGTVSRVSDFGVFVEIAPGIEGLIHMTKIPPTVKLSVGEEVNVYVEEVNARDRKIALGLIITTSKPIGYK